MEVPASYRHRLLATFNSGFKLADANGGWALHGHAYAPMRDGQATFVRYADGRYDVIDWHGGPGVPADVVFARQNLPLIVSAGRPNPNLSDGPEWGATLGNAVQVWRSGIGVDRHGNLIYAAANDQTVGSLAAILIHAGAVRAMELDINSYWVPSTPTPAPAPGSPRSCWKGWNAPPNATSRPTTATSSRSTGAETCGALGDRTRPRALAAAGGAGSAVGDSARPGSVATGRRSASRPRCAYWAGWAALGRGWAAQRGAGRRG